MQVEFNEFRDALNNGDFFIEYQPIMQIDGKKCLGAEALVRWRRGQEVIPPMAFIPAIENTPLSGLLTYWLVENIGQEVGKWLRKQVDAFISINIPPEVLGRGGLMHIAAKHDMKEVAEKIVIEITERGIPDALGLRGLIEGKKQGFKICLDDVGADNENLLVYARAGADLIKLDKSVADEMQDPSWSVANIGALAAFTRSTDIKVIAEGIESEYQMNFFQELGVQMGQGWYYSRSLSAEDFFTFFDSFTEKV